MCIKENRLNYPGLLKLTTSEYFPSVTHDVTVISVLPAT